MNYLIDTQIMDAIKRAEYLVYAFKKDLIDKSEAAEELNELDRKLLLLPAGDPWLSGRLSKAHLIINKARSVVTYEPGAIIAPDLPTRPRQPRI